MVRCSAALLLATCLALCSTQIVAHDSRPSTSTTTVTTLSDDDLSTDALRLLPLWPSMASEPGLHLPDNDGQSRAAQLRLNDIPFQIGRDLTERPTDLWDRVRNGFGLSDLDTSLVKDWEAWYASRPDYMRRMVEQGQRYLYYIVEEVEKRGMPSEIALLPFIESAYNPAAYSRAHASGIWQFIPSTGKLYGLQQNWWQDERRDVLAATRAALDYLEKLYDQFRSWHLALAAYNWGEGAVARAISRNEARGMRTDYVSLEMPAETRNYIPKLQAVKNIVASPQRFGVSLAVIANEPYFTTVTTDRHIDVKVAAKLAGMSLAEFQALNPAHNRPVIRADAGLQILLPTDRAEAFRTSLASSDAPLASWQTYTVGRGESVEQIAARFGIPAVELRNVNGIPGRLRSASGLTILVPSRDREPTLVSEVTPPAQSAAGEPSQPAARLRSHVVRAGETLSAVAQRNGVSPQQLMAWNGLRSQTIMVGQTLALVAPMHAVAARTDAAKRQPAKSATAAASKVATAAARPAARPAAKATGQKDRIRVASANGRQPR